jgi:hypothetical protein
MGAAPDVGADEWGCVLPAEPVRNVRCTRHRDDLLLEWDLAPSVYGYNVWTITDASDADLARLSGVPVATGVVGCASPSPCTAPTCTDTGGAVRAPVLIFYQVRATCGGPAEGP